MIKIIEKRDGTEEPFALVKSAKWNEWAAQNKVKWVPVFEKILKGLPERMTSRELQMSYINGFLNEKTWEGNKMAGRLYASLVSKDFYPEGVPTVKELHEKLTSLGFMRDLGYSAEEYAQIEDIIQHELDFTLAHFQIKQTTEKYGIQDRKNKIKFESPQFVDMRLAMAMAEHEPADKKIAVAKEFYYHFSHNLVNNPTPNYMYIGTQRASSPSCCLYAIPDSVAGIAAAHHIAEMMASSGAGLGAVEMLRSAGDEIRGGELVHFGKKRYLTSHSHLSTENTAAGRAGALNIGTSIFDPDYVYMAMAQNPRTPIANRNRMSHVTFHDNKTFARRVALNETYTPWNNYTAPELWRVWTSGNDLAFEHAYKLWEEANPNRPRMKARDTLLKFLNQENQVGTVYQFDMQEINRHTPHRDPINNTNLCTEIALPNNPYESVAQLYETKYFGDATIIVEDRGIIKELPIEMGKHYEKIRHDLRRTVEGYCLLPDDIVKIDNREMRIINTNIPQQPETALCNLSGSIISNMMNATDEELLRAQKVALRSIDYTINNTTYRLPQIGWTAKKRMNAGVGIMGLATWLARKGLHFDTRAGRSEMHRIAERHMYFLIKASIELGKEYGNAEWIDRTKWVDGWTPIQTANKNIDKYHDAELMYDWDELSQELIKNGGMRFSTLFTIPPGESSSKKSGPPNSIYPIRQLSMKKTDSSNLLDWVAPDAEELRWNYQSAWDIDTLDQTLFYGIFNKFTDHTVSCDRWRDRRQTLALSADKLIQEYLLAKEVGVPTQYYTNSRVASEDDEDETGMLNGGAACGAEGCSL